MAVILNPTRIAEPYIKTTREFEDEIEKFMEKNYPVNKDGCPMYCYEFNEHDEDNLYFNLRTANPVEYFDILTSLSKEFPKCIFETSISYWNPIKDEEYTEFFEPYETMFLFKDADNNPSNRRYLNSWQIHDIWQNGDGYRVERSKNDKFSQYTDFDKEYWI